MIIICDISQWRWRPCLDEESLSLAGGADLIAPLIQSFSSAHFGSNLGDQICASLRCLPTADKLTMHYNITEAYTFKSVIMESRTDMKEGKTETGRLNK